MAVRLQQELERPRSGPPFARADGGWELAYRRLQVDRMEYRFEADGESFCDPFNPLRAPGAFGDKSVVEFPGYAPPAWLAAPDPEPARAGGRARAPVVAARTPTRAGRCRCSSRTTAAEYERLAQLTRLDRPRRRDAAGCRRCRVALLDAPRPQRGVLRLGPLRPHARRARCRGSRPRPRHAGLGASLGALALLHTRWLHPGAFGALYLQSGSFFRLRWDRHESGFARFRRISRFVGTVLRAGPAARRSRSR